MILRDLRRLYLLLVPRDRRRVWVVMGLIALAACMQLASLAGLYAFLGSVTSASGSAPGWFRGLSGALGLPSDQIALAAMAFGLLLLANVTMALVEHGKVRLESDVAASISTRLLESYLRRDYRFFVQRNSTALTKNVLSNTRDITASLLRPALDFANKGTTSAAIIVLLLAVDPVVSLFTAAVMGAGYAVVHFAMRDWIRRKGETVVGAQRERFRVVSEAFGGIKETKVLGREDDFVRRFRIPSRRQAEAQASYDFSGFAHKYALETVAFGAIILLVAWMLARGRPVEAIVPIVGLMAIAGYRLLPAFRDISAAAASFTFHAASLDEVCQDFVEAPPRPAAPPLSMRSGITLDEVRFSYAVGDPVLRGISLRIPVGSVTGFVGRSGAGKSTLADLVMGLMRPEGGEIRIDDTPLTPARVRAWQDNLGYVPQEIFLADATIAENIAFGIPVAEIDLAAVQHAARLAQLSEFVEGLPQGYQTPVGERGAKLSGGQRQRIGIARALYGDPPVLVLDEATSDVDGATEASIAHAVRSLGGRKTVIVIAHRLTAIRSCDVIHFLEGGRLVATGSFEDLLAANATFRSMVEGLRVP